MKSRFVPIAAIVLSVMLHGLVFCIPAYMMYTKSKVKSQNFNVEQNAIPVEVVMLPALTEQGNVSAIKQVDGEKSMPQNEEAGLAGQAAKQGGKNIEKEMLTYRDIIKQRIQESRKYPPDAKNNGIEGGVDMAFIVLKSGQLKEAEIIKTSGNDSLDREALATINRAAPFPAMPSVAGGQEMQMQVRIVFKIE